ncbi:DUF4112 domain-containing protein [Euzebya tangerina]|uniref:DUF4112 domain-containing protein n=1 Tax=Euzebya tangerina TaxID=591198 RepID=UPI000E3163E7|nr:DUF4112 domain-containing protein [Euzebya tangerina]
MTDLPFAHEPAPPVDEPPLADPIDSLDEAGQERYRKMQELSHLLDNQFRIPGTDITFGVDAIVGFIPWFGGATGLAMAAVVIGHGIMIGARGATVVRMVVNALFDAALNAVPVLGYVSDLFFKANERNVRLLTTHAIDPDRTRAESRRMLVITALCVLGAGILALAAALGVIVWLISLIG